MPHRSRVAVALAVLVATTSCALGVVALVPAGAAPPGAVLPDLVPDPPTGQRLTADTDPATGAARLLLRFDGYLANAGPGPLEVRGARASAAAPMLARQHLQTGGTSREPVLGASRPSPGELVYETADGHFHWHVQRIARYSLWNAARSAEVAPAAKVGFCFEDTEHARPGVGPAAPRYVFESANHSCGENAPGATALQEGISAGWRDVYQSSLAFQWVDASDVQPGRYWLRSDVDPDGIVEEVDERNGGAFAAQATTIPGHVARPLLARPTPGRRSTTVTLAADTFGAPGPAAFTVVRPPAHGTLRLAGAQATYTPAAGHRGADSFAYAARDPASPFPRSPAVATVGLAGGRVALGGVPRRVVAGTTVQLRATVAGDAGPVAWSVDGVRGGTRAAGRITAGGRYTAPRRRRVVTVAATSPAGLRDARQIEVVPVRAAAPAPLPARGAGGLTVHRVGRTLVATVRPGRAGRVRVVATAGGRRLGACVTRTPARRLVTCRLTLRRGARTRGLRVVATLRVGRRVAATRVWRGVPRRR